MIDLDAYDYDLPEHLIRKYGLEPRDAAKLLVYETATDTITHASFRDVAKYIPKDSVLALNNTTVLPARLFLKKETGGKIEVFVLVNEMPGFVAGDLSGGSDSNECADEIPVLVDRKCKPGQKIFFPSGDFFEVVRQNEQRFYLRLHSDQSLRELLLHYGETPIPHYLDDEDAHSRKNKQGGRTKDQEQSFRERYQSVFAHDGASVAAPTASLHFTERVFRDLDKRGVEFAEVTLDVGLGTFAPLRDENFKNKSLHSEHVFVSDETVGAINKAKEDFRQVIAVGTTALRTLESVGEKSGKIRPFSGETNIFIYPPYRFLVADALMTNFHLPKSSLMLLVDAFLEHKRAPKRILDLYRMAIAEEYAFYSFGDSMLIL